MTMTMTRTPLDEAIEQSRFVLAGTLGGDADAHLELLSERDDVTLANPFGLACGRAAVSEALLHARNYFSDVEVVGVQPVAKYVSDDLACVVEVELYRAKVDEDDDYSVFGIRVTNVFRLEDGRFRLVHRHTDLVPDPPLHH
jgi:ketosteroid isomerase-like protein